MKALRYVIIGIVLVVLSPVLLPVLALHGLMDLVSWAFTGSFSAWRCGTPWFGGD